VLFTNSESLNALAPPCIYSPTRSSSILRTSLSISGNSQADAGLIKAGNPELRGMLIELAHRLKRWDPR